MYNSIKRIMMDRKANISFMNFNTLIFHTMKGKKTSKKVKADLSKAWKENDETDKELEAHFTEEWINVGDPDHDEWMKIPCTCHSVSNLQNDYIPF